MKRTGRLIRQAFRISLLLLFAVFALPASASEQGVLPKLTWGWVGVFSGMSSPEAALARMNAVRIEWWGPEAPQAFDVQPCPQVNWYNGKADTWCFYDPGYPDLAQGLSLEWQCPAEKPTPVWRDLGPGPGINAHYRIYCIGPQMQPPPPCKDGKCVGNPIQVNTRTKIQRDFDLGPGSLRFERTYTSNTGEWRHNFSTRAWNLELNNLATLSSNPAPACSWGTLSAYVPKQRVCLPYISNSDIGRTGAADWLVQRADGRAVNISSVSQRSMDGTTHETAHAVTSGGNFDGLVVYDGGGTVEFFDSAGRLTRRSQLDGGGTLLTYLNSLGQKHPASAPSCIGVSIGPGDAGRPSCATDITTGRQLTLAYDGNGTLVSVTDPAGRSVAYGYNGATSSGTYPGYDALTSITYPDATQRIYHYNEASLTDSADLPRALTGITDENSSRYAYFGYDAAQAALSTAHAGGVDAFTINPPWQTVTDALGRQSAYTSMNVTKVASDGSLASSVTLPDSWTTPAPAGGVATELMYRDAEGNLTLQADYRGTQTYYEYDLARNFETLRVEAYGTDRARWITTAWHPDWHLPVKVAEATRMTWSIYNGQPDPTNGNAITTCAPSGALIDGKPIAVLCKRVQQSTSDLTGQAGFGAATVGSQRVTTFTYNLSGQLLTVNGPRTDVNDVTTYAYYAADDTQTPKRYRKGDLFTVTNALGHTTTYNTYNGNGQPLTITDANGVVTTLTYDLRDRLTSRTVGTEQTTFTYWPTGLLKKMTMPDASYLEYVYDAAHRLTHVNDAEGNYIEYTLDAVGNRTKEEIFDSSAALANVRNRAFNVLNLISQEIGAANTANVTTEFGYDSSGNQTSIAAPLGRNTSQGYDELNRLTQVTDPLSGITQYGYGALDQLISVTDPKGLVTAYTYNGLGDLEQQVSPDTGTTTNTYDSGGNLSTSTDARNAITTNTYDALNRLATTSFAVGSTTDQTLTYTYDAGTHGKGRLTGVSDSNHSLSWSYDDHGRMLSAGQTAGSVSKTTSYTYSNGQRQSMTTPSGQSITYGYTHGKITSISVNGTVLVTDVLYDPFGPVRQWEWGSGALSVRTFDQDGKVTQIDSAGLKTYAYDDAFRITGITDTTNSALSWTYGYDDLDRLTSASNTGTTLGYSYDANGNRLAQTGSAASTFTVAANSNRLESTSGSLTRTYGYDNAGNTTSFTGVSFTYNNRGRMKSSTKSGVTTNYTYNALGQLINKGTSSLYYYDDAGHVLGVYNNSGALIEEIVWLGDIPLATLRPKSGGGIDIYYIHTDHLNTPRLITASVGSGVRWRWDAEPFGGGTVNNNPAGAGVFEFNLRFPGQIYLAETGLHYNYYRDGYDAATGRYTQSDPIGLYGGEATYSYTGGNPVMFSDPSGLVPGSGPPARPSGPPSPGVGDQINPFGVRGDGSSNYTGWFNQRFPKTIAGALAAFRRRIMERICANIGATSLPGLSDSLFDIDIQPNMRRFGDTPQGWWERNVQIGAFQIKTDPISVSWVQGCGSCFTYDTQAFVLENTGDNSWYTFGMARERNVRMGNWPLSGGGCCGGK